MPLHSVANRLPADLGSSSVVGWTKAEPATFGYLTLHSVCRIGQQTHMISSALAELRSLHVAASLLLLAFGRTRLEHLAALGADGGRRPLRIWSLRGSESLRRLSWSCLCPPERCFTATASPFWCSSQRPHGLCNRCEEGEEVKTARATEGASIIAMVAVAATGTPALHLACCYLRIILRSVSRTWANKVPSVRSLGVKAAGIPMRGSCLWISVLRVWTAAYSK